MGSATEVAILGRAHSLCRAAEPHGASAPCPKHLAEARRQLEADVARERQ